MKHLFTLSALAIACAPLSAVHAENLLEEVVITSSRIEMPLRQVGTSVSVLTAEDIEARGFTTLYESLRSLPSVSANNSGGAGAPTAVQIRGEDGYRTLVLIDGIDVSDTAGPQVSPRFEHLMSSGIGRIEVLRGPQGMIYGADAGGVISIETSRFDDGFHGDISAEYGRYGTHQLAGGIGGGNDALDYALQVSDSHTDGFNARDTDTVLRDNDGYDNTTVHAKAGWDATRDLRFQLVYRDVDTEGEYDTCYTAFFAPSDNCSTDFEQQAWRATADYSAGRFQHQLAYTGNDTERQSYTDGQTTFGADGDLEQWSYLGSFSGGDALKFVYGAEFGTVSLNDGTFDRERDEDGYFLEYQGEVLDSLYITAGARYDDNEDFGSHTSWRASGAYIIAFDGGDLKVRGTYGTGFRAPSLYEVAYNNGPFAYPPAANQKLQEEQSEGFDIGVAWYAQSGMVLEASYFDQTTEDIIYFDLVGFSGYLQDNDQTDSSGIELSADIPVLDSLSINGNYTYNDTEQPDGSTRPRRPEHLGNLAVNWTPMNGQLLLSVHLRVAREMEDTLGQQLDDYEVLDMSARWQVSTALQLYARMENVLDEDYQEVATYHTSGAAAYAGVRYRF